MSSYYDDVGDFHRKFDLTNYPSDPPGLASLEVLRFRSRFLIEELAEFFDACGMIGPAGTARSMGKSIGTLGDDVIFPGAQSLEKAADALADLVYVALGTAHFMGLPFDAIWAEVQRANMQKERATGGDDPRSKRGSRLDVVKPEGWAPPNHADAIRLARSQHAGMIARMAEEDARLRAKETAEHKERDL